MKSPLFKINNPEYMQDESFLYRLILCFFFALDKYAKIKGIHSIYGFLQSCYVTHPIPEQLKNLRTVLYKTVFQRFDCQF
ncbi:hypothetical protein B4125_1984 [Bacillus paralicheniformis]|nr:hypothetical protein SC10_B2orf03649 [Bacillus paralicheniformis]OLG07803.1 hypothetical protein B4125_1984 [Bacillus paralicheniformis]TWK40039.1 hypothetical protein CHCC20348_4315 [Bacillus paralicheniformis]TWK84644.1 hypothetical protein CHCC20331_2063 [Bacillus paralicheniformis]TWM01914.1 hypothetical protein CHCC15136_2218 [Bacillus paralicheniformis]